MSTHQILTILLILVCLVIFGYIFYSKKFKIETIPDSQIVATKFQGKIKDIVTDCFTNGACSVILESNAVITVGENPGDVSPEIIEKYTNTWGRLIGFELDKKYIGRTVEVYAKDTGSLKGSNINYYTMGGSSEYYIKLLP